MTTTPLTSADRHRTRSCQLAVALACLTFTRRRKSLLGATTDRTSECGKTPVTSRADVVTSVTAYGMCVWLSASTATSHTSDHQLTLARYSQSLR